MDTLDNLSFGFQSLNDILKSLLDKNFSDFLLEGVNYTWYVWSTSSAADFVENVLPEILELKSCQ